MGLNDEPAPAVSRRALLKAGAWAAPVIVIAAAAPRAAASNDATGVIEFTNVAHYWDWTTGITGLTVETQVKFSSGTGTIDNLTVVLQIENNDGQYLVGGVPAIVAGEPEWSAAGTGSAVTVGDETWISYTFLWAADSTLLQPTELTSLLRATVPLSAPLPSAPPGSPWSIVATAPGTTIPPASQSGTGATFIDLGPTTP